jgi:hypothetical protein
MNDDVEQIVMIIILDRRKEQAIFSHQFLAGRRTESEQKYSVRVAEQSKKAPMHGI